MRSFITHLTLLGISAVVAYFVVRVWDDWSNDIAAERERRRRAVDEHPSSSGPRYE